MQRRSTASESRQSDRLFTLDLVGQSVVTVGVTALPGWDFSRSCRPVVVGVDGSQGSARALVWALREALDRKAPVRVVTAWAWGDGSGHGDLRPYGGPSPALNVARQAGQTQEALLRAVLASFPGALPQLTTELVQADPASALIERSRDGVLLVLGSRGLTGADDLVVGSVADACLRHCSCPVVVIPAESRIDLPEPLSPTRGERSGLAPAVLGALGLL